VTVEATFKNEFIRESGGEESEFYLFGSQRGRSSVEAAVLASPLCGTRSAEAVANWELEG